MSLFEWDPDAVDPGTFLPDFQGRATDPSTGVVLVDGLLVPPGWGYGASRALGIVLAAAPRTPPSGFRPRLLLTRLPVVDSPGPVAGMREAGIRVEDKDELETSLGMARYLRLGWTAAEGELIGEMWVWCVGAEEFTLTGCVARSDFADHTDLFEQAAMSFDPSIYRRGS